MSALAEGQQVEVMVKAKVVQSTEPRLVFVGPIFDEWDIEFCIHGEKLRWGCDWCDMWFEENEK